MKLLSAKFSERLRPIPRKIYLPLLGLALILSLVAYKQIHKPVESAKLDAKYVSFDGDYFFSIPPKYIANGTALPNATLVYPENSPPQTGQILSDLYANGTVAVQAIAELKDNNPQAFSAYVKDVLVADLMKNFEGATDLRPAKQKGADANEIYALGEGGKRLRANYAINFTRPVLVVAQDRSDAFKTVGFSMEDLKKSSLKSDIDQAAQVAKETAQRLKDQNVKELRKNGTAEFNKQKSEEQLAATLSDSSIFLQRPISVVGGLYNGEFFIAQLVFESNSPGEQPAAGIVSLKKIGKTWKLDGLELPK